MNIAVDINKPIHLVVLSRIVLLYSIYKSIADTHSVEQVQAWLQTRKLNTLTWVNICHTNDKRLEVIKKCNLLYINQMQQALPNNIIPIKELVLEENGTNEKSVKLKIWVMPMITEGAAMPLIARTGNKTLNIVKGNRYYLRTWDDENIEVVDDLYLAGKSTNTIVIPNSLFCKTMTLAFCTTVYSTQGLTIKQPFTIHELDKFTWRMLYVALSRTTTPDHVIVS